MGPKDWKFYNVPGNDPILLSRQKQNQKQTFENQQEMSQKQQETTLQNQQFMSQKQQVQTTQNQQQTRVSVQGVKPLDGHFACLCRGFEFYEVKEIVIIFQKENLNTFTLLIIFIVKSLQKEQNSTNLLL